LWNKSSSDEIGSGSSFEKLKFALKTHPFKVAFPIIKLIRDDLSFQTYYVFEKRLSTISRQFARTSIVVSSQYLTEVISRCQLDCL